MTEDERFRRKIALIVLVVAALVLLTGVAIELFDSKVGGGLDAGDLLVLLVALGLLAYALALLTTVNPTSYIVAVWPLRKRSKKPDDDKQSSAPPDTVPNGKHGDAP